jgi:2-haloacid dehalogenase
MKYTTILFDSDNTLLNYSKSEALALKTALKSHGIKPSNSIVGKYREINDELWRQHEKGLVGKTELGVIRYQKLFEFLGENINAKEFNDEYMNNLSKNSYQVKGAISLLKKLTQMGVKCYIVTNGTAWIQEKRLGSSPIIKYISDTFVSEVAGHSKPDKRYFDYCFSRIENLDKSKTLLVGDSPSADILGAVNSGIDCCHFCPKGTPSSLANYSIKKLKHLLKIVK